MKAEYYQLGETLNYTNPTDEFVSAGTFIVFGSICGVAATDLAPEQLGTLATKGVWQMQKDAAAITGGAKVYYDEENDVITATAGDIFVGIAIADADAAETTVYVRLNG